MEAATTTDVLLSLIQQQLVALKNNVATLLPPESSSYTALVTQTSTNAPTKVAMKNDFGSTTFTFARSSAGVYTITASAATFTVNKTVVILGAPQATLVSYFGVVTSTTVITLTTGLLAAGVAVPTDALLTNTLLEIRVYA